MAEDRPDVLAFEEAADSDVLESGEGGRRAQPAARQRAGLLADSNPDALCLSPGWTETVTNIADQAGHGTAAVSWSQTGRGCRAVTHTHNQEMEVRLELIAPDMIAEVATARASTPEAAAPGLMGFEELGFTTTDDAVSSSLYHPGLDRLEEHRWAVAQSDNRENGAFHLVVAVEPDGEALRPELLSAIAEAELALKQVVADFHSPPVNPEDDEAIVAALTEVLTSIVNQQPLGHAATPNGIEAISFEYAFPENIAGIAAYRDDITCERSESEGECSIQALDATYRFWFIEQTGAWLLDGFGVDSP